MQVNTAKNQDGTVRSLKNRHIQMIAIGGTIGTGLFLGSGTTISKTGPSIMIVYLILGIFFFLMMRAIGEMFYSDPSQHTFVSFISKYLGPTAGYFTGWSYWLGLLFASMAELTAIATYFKFWFAMIKIIAIVSLIVTGAFMMIKGSSTPLGHASISNITNHFQLFPHGSYNFISAFPMVFFAFQGIEFVSITIGEAKNPKLIIKKAINETLGRILIFYIGALVVIMGVIPWTSLSPDKSPFVQVFSLAGIPAAAAGINFVVLTSAASSLNSIIFSAGRHFYQIASEGNSKGFMYKKFGKISKNGIPANAILLSALLILVTPIMSLSKGTADVFTIVSGSSSDMYIIVYLLAVIAHRRFRKSGDYLPDGFKMPAYKITSPLTIAFFIIIFISLFFIPEDIIGAIGAIIWTIVFGGIIYLKEKRAN